MVMVGAFLGGGNQTVPASKCLLHLSINTIDRANLSTASWTVTGSGKTFTATADVTGRADLLVDSGIVYNVKLEHQGEYYNDGDQKVEANSTGVIWVYFDLFRYPDVTTVVRVITTNPGITVTAKSGSNVMTAESGSDSIAIFKGLATGSTWTFSITNNSRTIIIDHLLLEVDLAASYPTIRETSLGMSFNKSTFATDPKGCLAYIGECAGFTPVSNPPSTLGKCQTPGSWDMNEDGSSSNPLLASCFYATFDNSGELHQLLNPKDLTQIIGVWNPDKKGWTKSSGTSAIESENTMFCFPAIYRKGNASSVTIGTTPESGNAWGATIDGHTYQYEAIGVYEGYVSNSKLMSLSGKASSASITRPTFRTYAAANAVKRGKAMLWNFHQWRDWWHLFLFAAKDFNGQRAIGQGGFPYSGSTGQGLCNKLGLWAGSTSTNPSASNSVKALIENPWGYKYEFIDDFVCGGINIYAGQNGTPIDSSSSMEIATEWGNGSGWQSGFNDHGDGQYGAWWGLRKDVKGSSTTYQCDYSYGNTSSQECLGLVGGRSDDVSDGHAGPSYLNASSPLSGSSSRLGARLAFVFDL